MVTKNVSVAACSSEHSVKFAGTEGGLNVEFEFEVDGFRWHLLGKGIVHLRVTCDSFVVLMLVC